MLIDRAGERGMLYLPTDAMQARDKGWFKGWTVGQARTTLRSVTGIGSRAGIVYSIVSDRIEGVSCRVVSCCR